MLRLKNFWIAVIILGFACLHTSGKHAMNQNTEELFQNYIEQFGRSYTEGSLEYEVRKNNFLVSALFDNFNFFA